MTTLTAQAVTAATTPVRTEFQGFDRSQIRTIDCNIKLAAREYDPCGADYRPHAPDRKYTVGQAIASLMVASLVGYVVLGYYTFFA